MLETNPYAYAKACGIAGRSFVGKRISQLAGLQSLSELERLLFPSRRGDLPGRELLSDLERRITARAVRQILAIVGAFSNPPELIVRMFRAYEYGDLKMCIQNTAAGEKTLPHICDLGRFATVRFGAFPDFELMLENTEFAFLLKEGLKPIQSGTDIAAIEAKLDFLYYDSLAKSLAQIPAEDRAVIRKIIADEISLRNCVWALRLRAYYHKRADETAGYLMDIKMRGKKGKDISLCAQAAQSLDFPLDSRSCWEGWEWEKLLNPEEAHAHWAADPRYFQNAASRYLYQLALKSFHRLPMSVCAVFCFIKIKQFEEDLLTSVAEGLALGMDGAGVFKLLEVLQ